MIKLLGLLLIVNAIAITSWWVTRDLPHKNWTLIMCLVTVFTGMFLLLQDRATEITVRGVGTIKAAAEQASADAVAIADVRKRIEAQSATVDLVAQQATNAQKLSKELSQKAADAEARLTQIDAALTDARKQVSQLDLISQFTQMAIAAQNDDRRALDQLEVWANDPSFPLRSQASATWATILDSHAPAIYQSGFTVPWRDGVDPSRLTVADLRNEYRAAPVYLRPALIEYVWSRQDIPELDRMAFLVEVVRTDTSLRAVEYAGRQLSSALGANLKPVAVRPLLEAWERRRAR